MKNILKFCLLLGGVFVDMNSYPAVAATVGRITIAGDASLTPTQLQFANNSAILTSSFFFGGTDTDGNLLPNLGLDGQVAIQPINLSPLGTVGGGRPSAISPLITNNFYFYPQNPGEDGTNFISGSQQFIGATFNGNWKIPTASGVYKFPGQISISAQGIPTNQSFSISGIALSPVEFIEDEAIPEPNMILGSLFGISLISILRTSLKTNN